MAWAACRWSRAARPSWRPPTRRTSTPGQTRRLGGQHSGQAGHHARQRARATWACSATTRSSIASAAALEATGIGFELGPERRRRPRQFLHARRPGTHQRSPRRPHQQRRKRSAGRAAARCEDRRASKSSSSRSRNTALWSCFAARAWAATCTTPIPRPPACRRWHPRRRKPGSERTAEIAAQFVAQGQKCWPARRRPTA